MAVVEVSKEMIWMKEFVRDLGIQQVISYSTVTTKVSSTLPRTSASSADLADVELVSQQKEISLPPRAGRRRGIFSDKNPQIGKWIQHVDKGVVGRKARSMSKLGWIGETPSEVKGEFVEN